MGKQEDMKHKKQRKHRLSESHPMVASVLSIITGFIIWAVISSIIELLCTRVLGLLPDGSGYPTVLGSLIILLIYKHRYKPEFEGALRGGRPGLGLRLWIPIMISWLTMPLLFMFTPAQFGWPTFITVGSSLAAGFGEEAIFRSYGLSAIMRKIRNEKQIVTGLAVTSVIFGVVHGFNILVGANSGNTMLQIISAGFLGVFFGALYLRCGNLWPSIIVHAVNDIIALTNVTDITEHGVVTGGVTFFDFLDLAICIVVGLIGFWMVRAEKRPEIIEIWNKKWRVQDDTVRNADTH